MEALEVAYVLGIDKLAKNSLDLMQQVEKGLPFFSLDRVVSQIAPQDANFKYRLIPKATWARKKAAAALSPDQSERLARLARIWALAKEIWVTEEETRDFLFRSHAMLEDMRPIDVVIASETGSEIVRDILGRLQFGTAA
jgi:putative toxin-antitoxin system antitoxin component (TIGR02293 family)